MDQLDTNINKLDQLNKTILSSVDSTLIKKLNKDRDTLINLINENCRLIKPKLTKNEHPQFNDLIRKYIIIQQTYRNTEMDIYATQLMMRDPNLTKNDAKQMIKDGYDTEGILCLLDNHACLNYVTLRHKEILKLEKSIQELHELFISTYAIVEDQGATVNRIANTTSNAKDYVIDAKQELKKAHWYSK